MINQKWQQIDKQKLANGVIIAIFIILVVVDFLVLFYLLRQRNNPAIITKNNNVFLPIIIRMPEPTVQPTESVSEPVGEVPIAVPEIYIGQKLIIP